MATKRRHQSTKISVSLHVHLAYQKDKKTFAPGEWIQCRKHSFWMTACSFEIPGKKITEGDYWIERYCKHEELLLTAHRSLISRIGRCLKCDFDNWMVRDLRCFCSIRNSPKSVAEKRRCVLFMHNHVATELVTAFAAETLLFTICPECFLWHMAVKIT